MRHTTKLLGLLLLSGLAAAAPITVQTLTYPPDGQDALRSETLKVPYVQGNNAAARINTALYLSQFNAPPPHQPHTLGKADKLDAVGTASLNFNVVRNDERVFAIHLEGEGCGAYCENFDQYLNFDARDGRLLLPDTLFTPAGKHALNEQMRLERRKRYRAELAQLQREYKQARQQHANKDTLDDLDARIALNQDCLAGTEPANEVNGQAESFYLAYLVQANSLRLDGGRCSNHASRALDDVYDVVIDLPLSTVRPWMSDYGRKLLLGDSKSASTPSLAGRVWQGKIGAAAVTLWVRDEKANHLDALYFYDKYRTPIALSGSHDGNTVQLDENDAQGKPSAQFLLRLDGDSLLGEWAGKQTLPVKLAP
ncbi:hypothetical protein SAMN02745857_02255 [Andreprevotia lacus DSM 23236]|jgi:hypothetical protein|uniref:Uncharacterized protein n=1 Tax=Andreprevotia lacus DSM 23236 TaxID=1121001 RepID=A0A1W1XPC2_9NEIS|nr:hypothetical protein [Andreprevotia lacus]SMC25727.1 hypothetical protein SAMN02745857_02255 [Andreprevotia lacus DSM 23236]